MGYAIMKRIVAAVSAALMLSSGVVLAQDAKKVEAGRTLFRQKECTKCHQIEGKGNKDHPLDNVATKMSEAEIRKWLTSPKEMEATLEKQPKLKMSSKRAALTRAQIDDLMAYLVTLK